MPPRSASVRPPSPPRGRLHALGPRAPAAPLPLPPRRLRPTRPTWRYRAAKIFSACWCCPGPVRSTSAAQCGIPSWARRPDPPRSASANASVSRMRSKGCLGAAPYGRKWPSIPYGQVLGFGNVRLGHRLGVGSGRGRTGPPLAQGARSVLSVWSYMDFSPRRFSGSLWRARVTACTDSRCHVGNEQGGSPPFRRPAPPWRGPFFLRAGVERLTGRDGHPVQL